MGFNYVIFIASLFLHLKIIFWNAIFKINVVYFVIYFSKWSNKNIN